MWQGVSTQILVGEEVCSLNSAGGNSHAMNIDGSPHPDI